MHMYNILDNTTKRSRFEQINLEYIFIIITFILYYNKPIQVKKSLSVVHEPLMFGQFK